MKHLKSKLMASAAMLMVATVMISSASFAWFTISTAPEVSEISTNVACNGNLEIKLDDGTGNADQTSMTSAVGDAGKNETWGNLIDLKGAFLTSAGANNFKLKPVKATPGTTAPYAMTFQSPKFGLDGRISKLVALTAANVDALEDTTKQFSDFGGVKKYVDGTTVTDNSDTWAVSVDFWLRTNMDDGADTPGNACVKLTSAADRGAAASGATATDGGYGLGSYITNKKITVVFVDTTDGTKYYAVPAADKTSDTDNYELTLKNGTGSSATAAYIPLVKNTPKLIKMYIYWDGENLSNSDFDNTISSMNLNTQFSLCKSDGTAIELNDLGATGTGYDKANAGTAFPAE